MTAQKVLQESEIEIRELLGLAKEKSVSPTRGHLGGWSTLQTNKWILFKRLTGKIELVPIPMSGFQALVEGVCWFQVWPETFEVVSQSKDEYFVALVSELQKRKSYMWYMFFFYPTFFPEFHQLNWAKLSLRWRFCLSWRKDSAKYSETSI